MYFKSNYYILNLKNNFLPMYKLETSIILRSRFINFLIKNLGYKEKLLRHQRTLSYGDFLEPSATALHNAIKS